MRPFTRTSTKMGRPGVKAMTAVLGEPLDEAGAAGSERARSAAATHFAARVSRITRSSLGYAWPPRSLISSCWRKKSVSFSRRPASHSAALP